jgi:hypothetical protein
MQTNQTPEALAQAIKDAVGEYANLIRMGHVADAIPVLSKLIADTDRLRDMAASGAKDAERLDWLEARRLEGIAKGYKWDSWSYDTDRPVRDQLESAITATNQLGAAIAATKRGGA